MKLLFTLLLIVTLQLCASEQYFVNSSYSELGTGMIDEPFSTFDQALGTLIAQKTFINSQIELVLDNIDKTGPYYMNNSHFANARENDSLLIRGGVASSSPLNEDSTLCSSLPELRISPKALLSYSTITASSCVIKAEEIKFQNIKFKYEVEDSRPTRESFVFSCVKRVIFESVCFESSLSGELYNTTWLEVYDADSTTFDDVVFDQWNNVAFSIRSFMAQISNLYYYMHALQTSVIATFQLIDVVSINITTITMEGAPNTTPGSGGANSAPNLLNVNNATTLDVNEITWKSSLLGLSNTFISISGVTNVYLSDIKISDCTLELLTIKAALFFVNYETRNTDSSLEISEVLLNNTILGGTELNDIEQKSEFKLFDVYSAVSNTNFNVHDIQILDSTINAPGSKALFAITENTMLKGEVRFENFTIEYSSFILESVISYIKTPTYTPIDIVEPLTWKHFSNFRVFDSKFSGCSFFSFTGLDYLSHYDLDFFKLQKLDFTQNNFAMNLLGTTSSMIVNEGFFLDIRQLNCESNYFEFEHSIRMLRVTANFFLTNSTITKNFYRFSGVVSDITLTNMEEFNVSDLLRPQTDDVTPLELNKGFYITRLHFIGNTFEGSTEAFSLTKHQKFITRSRFERNEWRSADQFIFSSRIFLPLPTQNFTSFQEDADTRSKLYSDHPEYIKFLNRQTATTMRLPEEQLYYIVVEGCIFKRNSKLDSYFKLTHDDSVNSGISMLDCTFDQDHQEDSPRAVQMSSVKYAHIFNSVFQNTNGGYALFKIAGADTNNSYSLIENEFLSLRDQEVLSVTATELDGVFVEGNTIENCLFSLSAFLIKVGNLINEVNFENNAIRNIEMTGFSTRDSSVHFFFAEILRTTSQNPISMANTKFREVAIKVPERAGSNFDDSVVYISLTDTIDLGTVSFSDVNIISPDLLIVLVARNVYIHDVILNEIRSRTSSKGAILVKSDEAQIKHNIVTDYISYSAFKNPVFSIDSQSGLAAVNISENRFSHIEAEQSGLLHASDINITLRMTDNDYKNLGTARAGSITLKDSVVLSIEIDSSRLIVDEILDRGYATQNLLYFEGCTTEAESENNLVVHGMEVTLTDGQKGSLVVVRNSSEFPLIVRNITLSVKNEVDSRLLSEDSTRFTSYGLLKSQAGSVTFEDITLEEMVFSRVSLFEISCSNSEPANKLTVHNSEFTNLTFFGENPYDVRVGDNLPETRFGHLIRNLKTDGAFCAHTLTISNSSFNQISTNFVGAIVFDQQDAPKDIYSELKQTIIIEDSAFNDVYSDKGGIVFSFGKRFSVEVEINNSEFTANSANKQGACFWLNEARLHLTSATFLDNDAPVGKEFYLDTPRMLIPQLQEQLKNGGILAELGPNALVFDLGDSTEVNALLNQDGTYDLYNVTSYTFQVLQMMVTLASRINDDEYLPVRDLAEVSRLYFDFQVTADSVQSLVFACVLNASPCNFTGIDVILSAPQGEVIGLTVRYKSDSYEQQISTRVHFRECFPGEYYDADNKLCNRCKPSEFSFDPLEKCDICPEGVDCDLGGNHFSLLKGYWRPSPITPKSYSCDDSKLPRCLGGWPGNGCVEGYQGGLCLQCDKDTRYIADTTNNEACSQCSEYNILTIAILMFVGTMIYQAVMIHLAYTDNLRCYKKYIVSKELEQRKDSYVRVFTTYAQMLGIVGAISEEIYRFLGASETVAAPVKQVAFSLDCLLLNYGVDLEVIYRAKIVVYLMSPIAKVLLFGFFIALFRLLSNLCKRMKKKKSNAVPLASQLNIWTLFAVTTSVLIIVEQPDIIATLTGYLSCSQLYEDDPTTYLVSNRNISCSTSRYIYFRNLIVLPALFFWGVLMPIALFTIMRNKYKQNKIYSSKILSLTLGAIYIEFKPERYFWGLIIMIMKVMVHIVNSTLHIDVATKALTLAQVFGLYAVLIIIYKNPYNDSRVYICEKLSILGYFITLLFSIYFLQVGAMPALKIWSLVAIFGVNIAVVVIMAVYFLRKLKEEFIMKFKVGQLNKHKKKICVHTTGGLILEILDKQNCEKGDRNYISKIVNRIGLALKEQLSITLADKLKLRKPKKDQGKLSNRSISSSQNLPSDCYTCQKEDSGATPALELPKIDSNKKEKPKPHFVKIGSSQKAKKTEKYDRI